MTDLLLTTLDHMDFFCLEDDHTLHLFEDKLVTRQYHVEIEHPLTPELSAQLFQTVHTWTRSSDHYIQLFIDDN